MMWKIAVVLLSVGIGASSANTPNNYPGCFPKFTEKNPRPNCWNEEAEGWKLWRNMQYKYFAKKVTNSGAFKECDHWDKAICQDEYQNLDNYLSLPVSTSLDGEIENAVLLAYQNACVRNGYRFWTGATHAADGKLFFSDGSSMSSNLGSFDKGESCVVFEVSGYYGYYYWELVKVGCDEKYPFLCRIFRRNAPH